MIHTSIDFSNTQIAFQTKSNKELRNSYMLFKAIGYNWLVQAGPKMVDLAFSMGLPIKGLIKKTVFHQFCGGENIQDCEKNIQLMHRFHVGTILDYSVEGKNTKLFLNYCSGDNSNNSEAESNPAIPFSVFKVTGVARFELLAKLNAKEALSDQEQKEYNQVKHRINMICETAHKCQVRLFIDAEESWIQDAIDEIATEMMLKYNKERAIIYNTIQFYRQERLAFLKNSIEHAQRHNYFTE